MIVLDHLGMHSRIPKDSMKVILEVLLFKSNEYKDPIKYRELASVKLLCNRNIIPCYDAKILLLEMIGVADAYDDVRTNSLFALANLVESNNISPKIVDKV